MFNPDEVKTFRTAQEVVDYFGIEASEDSNIEGWRVVGGDSLFIEWCRASMGGYYRVEIFRQDENVRERFRKACA